MTRTVTILGPTVLLLAMGVDLAAVIWLVCAPVLAGRPRAAAAARRGVRVVVGEVALALCLATLLTVAVLQADWGASPPPPDQYGLAADTAARLLTVDLVLLLGMMLLLVVTLIAGAWAAKDES